MLLNHDQRQFINFHIVTVIQSFIGLYDVGLSDDYKYFVAWFQAACNGKSRCQGRVPKWYEIIGKNTNCPQNGTNYFHKVLVHLTCDCKFLIRPNL